MLGSALAQALELALDLVQREVPHWVVLRLRHLLLRVGEVPVVRCHRRQSIRRRFHFQPVREEDEGLRRFLYCGVMGAHPRHLHQVG